MTATLRNQLHNELNLLDKRISALKRNYLRNNNNIDDVDISNDINDLVKVIFKNSMLTALRK